MKDKTERLKDIENKIGPLLNGSRFDWESIDNWTDRDIEIAKLVFLRNIDNQTSRSSRNLAFFFWVNMALFVIYVIIILGNL